MWRVLFPIQTLMGHRRAAAGRAKGRALRRERVRGIAFTFIIFEQVRHYIFGCIQYSIIVSVHRK